MVKNMVKRVILNNKGVRLLNKGILTIYKDGIKDDGGAEAGEEIFITNQRGKILGGGFYDGHGPVAIRVLYKGDLQNLEEAIERNILASIKRRDSYPYDSKRIVYADADYLPGLIIDKYKNVAVIQTSSIGMDIRIDIIKKALIKHGDIDAIYLKNTQRSRLDIGLELYSEWLTTDKIEEVIIREGKAKFIVDIVNGQKTGFYLDHRINRLGLPKAHKANVVVDLYSYTGGFGIHYLLNGSNKAYFIEQDENAVDILQRNLKLNKLDAKAEIIHTTVEEFLETNLEADIVIVDPPALAPTKKNVRSGVNKYKNIIKSIITSIKCSTLFISSCSYHITPEILLDNIITNALDEVGMEFWILGGIRKASPDHAIRKPNIELDYLKAYLIKIKKI